MSGFKNFILICPEALPFFFAEAQNTSYKQGRPFYEES